MADQTKVDELIAHLDEEYAKTKARILGSKPKAAESLEQLDSEAIQLGVAELPEGEGGLASGVGDAVGGVIGGAGKVVGGVASTGADVIGVVGTVADATHGAINDFFHNLRRRLGV